MHGLTSIARSLGTAAALLALAACQPNDGQPPRPAPLVEAQTVALEDYALQITLTGTVKAQNETPLSFRVSGQIVDRLVDVGDHVEAGEVLARLDGEEQQADLRAAQAALTAAQAQVQQAQAAFDRQNTLLGQGFTTRTNFDAAQAALQTAQGSRDAAQAQLASAEEALTYTELKARAAGVVTQRNAEAGEVAQAAQAIFVVAEDGPRDAVFDVQESAFLQPEPDLTVKLALVSDPRVTASGTIREIAPTLDPDSGTIAVKVGIIDAPAAMTLGAAVTGIATSKPVQKIILPASALWSEDGKPVVWTVDPQSHAVSETPVVIDIYRTGTVVIESGLTAGQVVVTKGTQFLVPQQVVAIVEGATP